MAEQQATVEHPTIGTIRGIRRSGASAEVDQFLGIQYAQLKDAFARGVLKEEYKAAVDATSQGPLPIASPQNCDNEHLLLQHSLPRPEYTFSGTECLNLNVSTPSADVRGNKGPLPVVVFVHGGGFVTGSGSWPQWDLGALVELSVAANKPIVAVGINYRLGIFGFLTSKNLRASGYSPNNGLHDQKLAFRWVKKNISGFGGDPEKITFLGSSIGGGAGFIHLQSEEALFKQLAALGGSGLIRPLPLEVVESTYEVVTKQLGIDSLPADEQVAKLIELSKTEEFKAQAGNLPIPIGSTVDQEIVRAVTTYSTFKNLDNVKEALPGTKWCDSIFMSDSRLDGMVFHATVLASRSDNLPESLEKCLKSNLGDNSPLVSKILSAYGIDKSNSDALPIINFLNDIGFRLAAQVSANTWARLNADGNESYVVHFDVENPWPGMWQGHASHALELAFLLQNYNEHLGPKQKAIAKKMAYDFIAFANGEAPLESYGRKETTRTYFARADDQVSHVTDQDGGDRLVPVVDLDEIVEWSAETLDKLMDAMGQFFAGPA